MTPRKTLTRIVVPLAALLLMALLIAACVAPVETGAADMMDDEMKVLTVAVGQEPTHLEATWVAGETNCNGCRNIMEMLVRRNYETGAVLPMLATSWERIDDRTLQFTLRQGVTFHDGAPFNAEAVAVSINYMWTADLSQTLTGTIGATLSAEAVDEYTVNVSAADPDQILLEKLYFVVITSPKQIQEEPETYASKLVGTGPYMMEEWRRGESLIMVANPDWWGNDDPEAGGGKISFDKLIWRFLPEDTVRAAAAQAGEVDIAQFVTPDQCKAADGRPQPALRIRGQR